MMTTQTAVNLLDEHEAIAIADLHVSDLPAFLVCVREQYAGVISFAGRGYIVRYDAGILHNPAATIIFPNHSGDILAAA